MNTISTAEIIKNNNAKTSKEISELKLHQKELSVIPSLKEFSNLKILDVSCNRLKNLQFVSSNSNLATLIIYDNELTDLSGLCQLRNLSVLHAQYNAVKNIDTCFYNLSHLTDLRLDDNEIEKVGLNALQQCTALINLDLSYNCIDSVEFLAGLPNLTYLALTHNQLQSIKPLSRCPKLNELDVSDNSISEHGLEEDGFMQLERLNLSNNAIVQLNGELKLRGGLTALILNGNKLTELPEMKEIFPNLDVFEVSKNKIRDFDKLLNSICGCKSLRELSFEGNPFDCDDDSVTALSKMVKKRMPNIACLNGVFLETLSSDVVAPERDRKTSHSGDIFKVIEAQLSHLSALTAPLEDSFSKSFSSLQDVLSRLELQDCAERSIQDDEKADQMEAPDNPEGSNGFAVCPEQGDIK